VSDDVTTLSSNARCRPSLKVLLVLVLLVLLVLVLLLAIGLQWQRL